MTTLAVGAQGHEEQEPKQGRASQETEKERGTLEQTANEQCGRTEAHMVKAERSLLFLTAAGAVC